jgi:cellulose biosynthesis protein BcsQ
MHKPSAESRITYASGSFVSSPDRKVRLMNVIVFASRKGGTGKSTLTAHLAAYCHTLSRSCLLVDADQQGSLTLWHRLRKSGEPALKNGLRDFNEIIAAAQSEGFDWVFVDTPPLASLEVTMTLAAATLVIIPTRPAVFDLNAVTETIAAARLADKPFAVVLNAVPPKRLGAESPMATNARRSFEALEAPVWSGQITNRASLSLSLADGASVEEYNFDSRAASEEIAALWTAIDNSVLAINGAYDGAVMHRKAA